MVTPKVNSLTSWPKDISLMTDGTDFSDGCFLVQAHSRIDEGKVTSKCHMQIKERGEETSHRVADARLVCDLAVLPKSLRSPQDGGSSNSVAPSTRRLAVLTSNDETTHQSQETQCDGTIERSTRQLEAQFLTNFGNKFRYTTFQAVERTRWPKSRRYRSYFKNWRNWRQTWCSSVPSQWSHVEDLHDFMHVDDSAPQQGWWSSIPTCTSEHWCCIDWEGFHHGAEAHSQKCMSWTIQCYVLMESVKKIPGREWFGSGKEWHKSSNLIYVVNSLTLLDQSCSSDGVHPDTSRYSSSKKFRRWWSTRTRDIRFSGRTHHLHVNVERYWLEPKEQWRHLQKEIHHSVSFLPEDYRLGAGHFSTLEMWKDVMGPCRGRLKETGTTPPKILKGDRKNFVHYIASSETAEQFAENNYCRYWAQ